MKRLSFGILTIAAILFVSACEDVINPKLQPAETILVVDAWINDLPDTQTIRLTWSQPYFEYLLPPVVSGAMVQVRDELGKSFLFAESVTMPGTYEWAGSGTDTLRVGGKYQLEIQLGGEMFTAQSYMGRVPVIDSITFEEDDNLATGEKLIRSEFWATDPEGQGDAYWIKAFKNGTPLLKPSEINIAFDAGLSIGGPADGVIFIPPVRRRINPNDLDDDGNLTSPIAPDDSMHVQIHSVTVAAFTFLNEVAIQTNRPGGFAELFATPLANVSTNIVGSEPAGTRVVGFFNVSAVSSNGGRYKP